MSRLRRPATRAVHAGEGAAVSPRRPAGGLIHQTAPYLFDSNDDLEAAFAEGGRDALYSRQGNPTVRVVEEKIAALEAAPAEGDAIAFASGMAAISSTLDGLLAPGDHLLAARELYGGTHAWIDRLAVRRPAVAVERVAGADLVERLAATDSTAPTVVYVETPTNPLLRSVDLTALATACRARGARLVVDSTFATPVLQNPLELGAHVVVHSATKYLAGHSDVTAGVAVAAEAEVVDRVREAMVLLGGCLDPHAAYLVARGMKTLELRVLRQSETAARLADRLAGRPEVNAVHYPGNDPIARRQMRAGGGILSVELEGGLGAARRFLEALELVRIIPSLGGVETGAVLPAVSSHRRVDPAERRHLGIADGLVRLSCGIEAVEDLEEDLLGALEHAARTG